MLFKHTIIKALDRILGLEKSEAKVQKVKDNAIVKMDEVTTTLEKAGKLQRQIMRRTTTYYIGRAIGSIR